jgi:hypothetical protein
VFHQLLVGRAKRIIEPWQFGIEFFRCLQLFERLFEFLIAQKRLAL